MTARCPNNGTSSLKPGAGQENVVAGTLITAGLEALGPWTTPLAALIDGFVYEGSTQCPHDPPPMPTWDSNDALTVAIGLLNPNAQQTITKVNNLLLNYAWDLWCQCDSGTATAAAPTAAPPGVSIPSANPITPCFEGSYSSVAPQCLGTTPWPSLLPDVTTALLPTSGGQLSITDPGGTFTAHGVPAGLTTIYWTYTLPTWSFGAQTEAMTGLYFYDSSGNETAPHEHFTENFPANAPTFSYRTTLPAGTTYYRWVQFCNTNVNIGHTTSPDVIYTRVFCGGSQPGQYSSCCPPDPGIALALNNILSLLQQLAPQPKGYTRGTVHDSLTGEGSIAVTGLWGVLAEITQGAGSTTTLPGVPPYQWNVGWLSLLTGDGFIDEKRLTRQAQVWSSQLAPYATTFGYHVNPGFVVRLTELLPA